MILTGTCKREMENNYDPDLIPCLWVVQSNDEMADVIRAVCIQRNEQVVMKIFCTVAQRIFRDKFGQPGEIFMTPSFFNMWSLVWNRAIAICFIYRVVRQQTALTWKAVWKHSLGALTSLVLRSSYSMHIFSIQHTCSLIRGLYAPRVVPK